MGDFNFDLLDPYRHTDVFTDLTFEFGNIPLISKPIPEYLQQCFLNFFNFVYPYHRFLHVSHPRYKNNISRTYNQDFGGAWTQT